MKSICLNMIVRNEEDCIVRCLESTLPIIDSFCIVDTGSNDGTIAVIKAFMDANEIPGKVIEMEWKDFSTCRNKAFEEASGLSTHLLFMDADDYLSLSEDFDATAFKEKLADINMMPIELNGLSYANTKIVANQYSANEDSQGGFRWVGRVHEAIFGSNDFHYSQWDIPVNTGIRTLCTRDGNRSNDPKKYAKDAELLLEDFNEDPSNTRTVFYLAQSYRDAGEPESAILFYKKRAIMGGWDQEVYISYLQAGHLTAQTDLAEALRMYMSAREHRPDRLEAQLSMLLTLWALGFKVTAHALCASTLDAVIMQLGMRDVLFVDQYVYDYWAAEQIALIAEAMDDKILASLAAQYMNLNKIPEGEWLDQRKANKERLLSLSEFIPDEQSEYWVDLPSPKTAVNFETGSDTAGYAPDFTEWHNNDNFTRSTAVLIKK